MNWITKINDKNLLTNSLSTAVRPLIRLYSWCFTITTGSLPSNRSKGNNSFKWRRETFVSEGISAARAKKKNSTHVLHLNNACVCKCKSWVCIIYTCYPALDTFVQSDRSHYLAVYWNLTKLKERDHNKREILLWC